MSRNYSDHYRPSPSSKNHHHNNNCFSFPPHTRQNKSNTHRAHQPFWEIQDDLIAPTHSSLSIPSLQRWARATAAFPQSGLGRREHVIVERIERRYGTMTVPRTETLGSAGIDVGFKRDEGFKRDSMHQRKRERDVEGDEGGGKRRKGEVIDLTAEEGERDGEGKGDVIDLTGEHEEWEGEVDYAQSSEWSWPGSQEDGR
ncbi:hypothetical protein HBI56_217930 [Parastagonospora nodorum]|uniref:Uncharacterized protein n=1 Tax=Phaeosphaeria nodorum (strain SN15 / ATCC MYA-4574 / FGSC 10173) TaxID=321614 RepID=A0A7U2I4X6_PHANO|nr:hypothetical protein HBH56_226120 [Parastagonospora nodorum]QRD01819.1 hypothetical protein JI435_048010 [Parastagonospora nodorum SN15]KAH3935613.1 hypothetical protein HBH54_032600 [Parastagonospora nodorum]KAH3940066.1 hypothetical protein HBH53_224160 [Parastagonospora nodorum]KAH3957586.1 hypothetical protein HBH51_222540 [Parastagonospora nodorum]